MGFRYLYGAGGTLVVLLAVTAVSAKSSVWQDSYNPADKSRFIPVELWTGAPWTGERDLEMTTADLTFGDRRDKTITGPSAWMHPILKKSFKVYERKNKGKVQLFTVRGDGAGLGRVYDSRGERFCFDGMKFPLGVWREGETRRFTFTCWRKGRPYERVVRVTIEKIDFEYQGTAHALRYVWVADAGDKENLNNAYTYAPRRGNVALEYRH